MDVSSSRALVFGEKRVEYVFGKNIDRFLTKCKTAVKKYVRNNEL
jgi:hypothetical protein